MGASYAKLGLRRIEIEGFRGINRSLKLDFGDRATLICAPNGQGKTSLLGAIEWCLFGQLAYQIKENATSDEVVNLHHPNGETVVRLTLQRGEDQFVIERRRRVGKREMSLSVISGDGTITDRADVDSFLFRLLGLTFEDFYRASYLHQESVRGLLTDVAGVRDEALDRLFGLDKLRDILAAIQVRPVIEAIEGIRGKKQRAYDKLAGAAQQLELQRHRHLQEAEGLGLTEPELTLERGLGLARDVLRALGEFGVTYGATAAEIVDPESIDDLERVARKVKEAIRDNRLSASNQSPAALARGRLTEVEALRDKLEAAVEAVGRAAKAVQTHEDVHGTDDGLGQRKGDLWIKRDATRRAIAGLDTATRLLGDAVAVVRADAALTSCPVCDQPVSGSALLASLEGRLGGVQRAEHARLTGELESFDEELDVLGRVEQERSQLRDALVGARRDQDRALEEARGALPELPIGGDGFAAVEEEVRTARTRVEEANSAQFDRERALDTIDQSVDRLRALHKVVKDDDDSAGLADKVGAQGDSEEDDGLTEELDRLVKLQDSLQSIAQVVQNVARLRARDAIDSSRESTAEYYRALCNHPYFDRLRIDAREKTLSGIAKNTYTVRVFSTADGTDTLAGSRLSTAQMNCVALSIYLALAGVLSHNLGFIILDDPSQNLDTKHKAALAGVLSSILPTTQLVVSTQDDELERFLKEQCGDAGVIRYRLAWTPKEGTSATAA